MAGGVKKRSKSQGSTEDMISNLPDPLLHHIFSFLTMEDVVKTSLLSKRWKYLWTSLSVLNYPYLDRNSDAAAIIGTTLLRNQRIKIQRLSINLDPLVRACHSHIDSWIDFAMRRNVEELHIKLKFEEENRYKAPRFLLDCGTLRVLKLRHVDLPLPVYFHLCLLTKLDISQANLTHLDTSHCPLLEGLIIRCCNRNINIYAPNRKLRYLKIVEAFDNDCGLTLYAPHLSSIEFRSFLRQFYTFQDLSSLRTATLFFMDDSNSDCIDTTVILKLLKDLRHAEVVKLGNSCIKTLGSVETSPLSATYLELTTDLCRWELPGFASLLQSLPFLESLSIDLSWRGEGETEFWCNREDYDIDKPESWKHLEFALCVCLNLRTVTIHNFLERYIVFDDEVDEIKLVRLMLKECKVLGKMIVVTSRDPKWAMESKLLHTVKKKLLAFPRVSESAEIFIS